MRVLWFILLAWLGISLWRNWRRRTDRKAGMGTGTGNGPAIEMVACEVCLLHLPRSEALVVDGHIYCSAAHRQQAQART